ncbi:hypothetical protein [Shimia sp. SDUM112013]|uniref:hypothetical protein n=1 Tax=Shimia sp. SDUM112013 TaxID=3136160 RepID=UPI0032ECF531
MTLNGFLLIIVSITFSALGQTSFKIGVDKLQLAEGSTLWDKLMGFALSPTILLGFGFYGVGAFVWLLALRQTELSLAYPFVALSFVIVFLIGVIGLGETVNATKITGLAIIILGTLVLARA